MSQARSIGCDLWTAPPTRTTASTSDTTEQRSAGPANNPGYEKNKSV